MSVPLSHPKVRATYVASYAEFNRLEIAGSIHLQRKDIAGLFRLFYFCPCGCRTHGVLAVGEGEKPGGNGPSWRWNGSRSDATLDPSVHHVGHWHGWLREGYWEVCA